MADTRSTEMTRPNRPMHADGHEQVVISESSDGRRYSLTLRQVGWIGQSGDFYSLGENPAPTEPGSFSPLWFIAHEDKVEDSPTEVSWLARLVGWFRRRAS